MRMFVAFLIVLTVLYFWDRDYNNGRLLDGLDSMRRSIFPPQCGYLAVAYAS
jgi:hypothetical protein